MRRNELLLVVVPYRDRSAHLASFMARVWRPLRREHTNSRLIVAEQSVDGRRFNRGALLNAALHWYREHGGRRPARVLLHDVDLEPCARMRRQYYGMPSSCLAVAYGRRWGRYPGAHYFGGVVGLAPTVFWRTNGYPNALWGWGGEDDALYRRLRMARVRIDVPTMGRFEDLERMTLQQKLRQLRDDRAMCPNKRELRNARCGIRQVRYRVLHRREHVVQFALL